ncbi:hypothetical protein IMCC1989_8 [gamma proteobacterium IMCC1989]|nr:hypothetical protein IMCC1989_8 [gamma proteobacterium IMCC1989]
MSWKNFKQHSLADTLLIERQALTKLNNVHELIHWETN